VACIQLSRLPLNGCVTNEPERDQIILGVIPDWLRNFSWWIFKIGHSARLASPAIPSEYFVAEQFVQLGLKPQSRLFWLRRSHEAFSVT
jgi:hypothetical protein